MSGFYGKATIHFLMEPLLSIECKLLHGSWLHQSYLYIDLWGSKMLVSQ